ncbi:MULTISPECIES: phosphotransferase [Actinosynnema]|uniref:phosphotransferase n=1 Tax=Actinosynnema TaxID=40566 RepID=UPI0020A54219|nr:phosphotransferase [Actinosynnema pretiosum]MCP2096251.1 Phosphotransferase enzyme family protein [Actinosynnema pretiosum]
MTGFATPQDIAARTAAALDAAVEAGRELGLDVGEAEVLYELFSVVVRLAPSPVVARVPVVLPATTTLDSLAARQRDELAVAAWLAGRGVPVIEPSPLAPAEPVRRGGFSMTFWTYVEQDRERQPDYAANTESTARLHAALRDYPGELAFLSSAEPEFVTAALAELAGRPDLLAPQDLERALREWEVLEPLVRSREAFEARFPGVDLQPVHGDSPPANIFHGVDGDRYSDFEMVTLGPVEWDLGGLGAELASAYDKGAREVGIRELDADALAFVDAVGKLRIIACLALVPQLPVLADYLTPAVDQWRAGAFAGGVVAG